MSTLLEQQVEIVLTAALGRTPTAEEIRLGTLAPYPLSDIHNTANIAENTISISTTDDIQDAIDKVNLNGGGVVYLNPGTYNVSDDITLPSNVYLVGLVKNLCIIDFGGGSHSIVCTAVTDITIAELTIQNSSDAGIKLSTITGIIILNNVDIISCAIGLQGTTVAGLNIISGGIVAQSCGIGMQLDACRGTTIDNSSFIGNTTYGMELIDSDFSIVRGCYFQLNGSDAIHGDNIDTFAIEACIIIENTGDGINIDRGCIGNRIFGNRISVNNNGVVIGNSATACINNIIGTNSITSNLAYGVVITGANATNNLISSNTILANVSGQVDDSGTTTLIRSNVGEADN